MIIAGNRNQEYLTITDPCEYRRKECLYKLRLTLGSCRDAATLYI
jgi:hypothetical protein